MKPLSKAWFIPNVYEAARCIFAPYEVTIYYPMNAFRFFLVTLCVMIAVTVGSVADNAKLYVPGTIILKFKQNSEQYQQWLQSGRSSEINELVPFIGAHSTEAYLSDATLHLMAQRYTFKARIMSPVDPISQLRQIAVIHTSKAVDLGLLVNKMKGLAFVEYVEQMPERHLCFTPNDTLYSDIGEYFVKNTRAMDAWDLLPDSTTVKIAIVDTGVDYTHEDLKDVIATNEGEMGLDASGHDKRTNGIDDDNNGFVDDWIGWDFAGAFAGAPEDNDPAPGYIHGTHCAGIAGATVNNHVGIAGTCNHARILAVKIGTDNAALIKSYEGIAYAAGMGAPVISCSWGGGASSLAEQDVVNAATELGSLIVVAGGNDGAEETFYPAGYKNVLAVAAVGRNDSKASFSNYGTNIGVSAPGVHILSTLPGGFYDYMDGTSMATPCAAGVCGLVCLKYPQYSPLQVSALVRATADNIDTKLGNNGQPWMHKIGSGRVNAYNALTVTSAKLAQVISVETTDSDGDGAFDAGNTVNMVVHIQNLLAPLTNAQVMVVPSPSSQWVALSDTIQGIGPMIQSQSSTPSNSYHFVVPANLPENSTLSFDVTVLDENAVVCRSSFTVFVRPTYRTLRNNNITITVNSRGNFAYNDYSSNFQGDGCRYKNSSSFLFEGGLMLGTQTSGVYDVVRGNPANNQDSGLVMDSPAVLNVPGILANTQCSTTFHTSGTVDGASRLNITQDVLQNSGNGQDNFVISQYDISNPSTLDVSDLYCGVYADWDIDASGQNNIGMYDPTLGFYYVQATAHSGLPWIGMQLLSQQPLNVYMMDNDGTTSDNIGVYDNYTAAEKWTTLSSGIARTQTNNTDVSAIIGAGPFNLKAGNHEKVVFSIFAGMNLDELKAAADAAKSFVTAVPDANSDPHVALSVYPNPLGSGNASVRYVLPEASRVSCELVDLLGNTVQILAKNELQNAGSHIFVLNPLGRGETGTAMSRGTYFVRLTTQQGVFVEPCIVLP